MSAEKETFEKLQDIVSSQLGIESSVVVASADFTKELGADSLDVVEIITIQDAVTYIEKRLSIYEQSKDNLF